METGMKYQNPSPHIKANCFSKGYFCWIFPFLRYGYKNEVQMKDIYNTEDKYFAEHLGDLLEINWNTELKNAESKGRPPNLIKALIRTFGWSYMKSGLLLVLDTLIIRIMQPILLREFLRFFQEENEMEIGWILGVFVFLIIMVENLVYQQYFVFAQILGMRTKLACSSLIYRKVLKLSHTSLGKITSGEIVNLLSNDMQRIESAAEHFHFIYQSPIQVIFLSYVLYCFLGISCVPGLLFIIIEGVALQGYLSKIQAKLRTRISFLTGQRLAAMDDVITGIQVIKMYAWEKPFEKVVGLARKLELSNITKLFYIKAFTVAMVVFTERFSLFLTLITYVLLENRLTGDVVFSSGLLFNIVQASICYFLPLAFESCTDIKVSTGRLQKFLLLEENEETRTTKTVPISKDTGSIRLTRVSAEWLPGCQTLADVSLNIKPGTLCCVLGKVGAGKSSLLQLLLKELPTTSGKAEITGKISYASQEPWLFVASVRNNILFGQNFMGTKYKEVVTACALVKDFQQFPHRDQTMVGERGVSLSGGQRARINLARAVYSDADIYLLDDPLSAVDSHVAKHLFEECIMKYLKKKTRILVTHQIQFLKQADLIVILDEGKIGRIMKNDEENSLFDLNQVLPDQEEVVKESQRDVGLLKKKESTFSISNQSGYEVEQDEEIEMISKDVSFYSFMRYFKSGTSICSLIFTLVVYVVGQIVTNMSDMWITYWTNKEQQNSTTIDHTTSEVHLLPEVIYINSTGVFHLANISTTYYNTDQNLTTSSKDHTDLYIYSGLILSCVILSTIRPMMLCNVCMNASRALHRNMLSSILWAPIRFFETNPSGRILNRFSKDTGAVDEQLVFSLFWATQIYLVMIGIIVMVCIVTPWIIIPFLVVAVATYYTMLLFLPTALNIVKMQSNNRSPIFSHITATVSGLSTIRSSEAEGMVKKYFDSLQDIHTSTQFMNIMCSKSFCFYIQNIYGMLMGVIVFTFLVFKNEDMLSGSIGLVLSQTNILAGMLQYGITMTTNAISSMVSVERILQYTNIEKEDTVDPNSSDQSKEEWPCAGRVTFTNVCLTYVPGDPLVLKYLNLNIRAGEKVGVVGRTGAGKSSLITCLFRLTPFEGTIAIDGIDINTVSLTTLRSNISIIPQEPMLFSETLRYNLDPLGKVSDDVLWRVLENVELKDSVENLDQKVSNGGSNFSAGQKQLICLARAIIRNNKILVMDEATANVDPNTDALIQRTIRDNFRRCTVLTIAHRLNTIMDSDRVLVMNSGKVVEFAHPHELLQKSTSYFTEMVKETGQSSENLREIAREDFEKKFYDTKL